jgi:hypothetical protein
MNSQINARQMGVKLNIDQARTRQTPKTDFGTVLKSGLSKTADVAMMAGSIAAPFIPGGAVVSAAISGVAQLKDAAGGLGSSSGAASANSITIGGGGGGSSRGSSGVSGGGGSSGNTAFDAVDNLAASGDPNAAMFNASKAMSEMNMSQNLQYLDLQQKMQQDNRQFTLVSNIMKVKHDTAKNAINNVR